MMKKPIRLSHCLAPIGLAFVAQTARAQEVPLYGAYELELTATGTYANPYLQMPGDNDTPGFVAATFSGPGDEQIQIDGFWDGGSTWRVRFAPTVAGAWSYITSSADSGLNGVTGTVQAVASSYHGFVEVDPTRPHHFRWTDGTPYFYAPTSMRIADSVGLWLHDGTFQDYIARRREQGFNAAFWGYWGFNKPGFNNHTQVNEGGAPFVGYDPDNLNPAYHQYGDQRVQVLLDNGIMPMISLGWRDENIQNMGHSRLKRYWRYLLARYAAYNVSWNIFGEGIEWEDAVNVVLDYGNLTKKWDPYDHLATVHTPPPGSESQQWMDFITLQTWNVGTTALTSNYLSHSKPVLNAEYGGYENTEQVTSAIQLRRMVWDIVMRGGYYVYEAWTMDTQLPGALSCALLNWFFREQTSHWLLEYRPALFGGKPGLANPGEEYVVYLSNGGTVDVTVADGGQSLEGVWFDPATGQAGEPFAVAARTTPFTAPGTTQDWVLHIRRPPAQKPSAPTDFEVE